MDVKEWAKWMKSGIDLEASSISYYYTLKLWKGIEHPMNF
jgi:hypothetical protein